MRGAAKLLAVAAVALVLAGVPAGCGGDDDEVETTAEELQEERALAQLDEQSDSGQSGAAQLESIGNDRTRVVLTLDEAAPQAQPAHVHRGTCDDLEAEPAYPLKDVRRGKSETTIDVPVETLREDHAINVHKSAQEADTYVACGEIISEPVGGE